MNKYKYIKFDSFLLASYLLAERCELIGTENGDKPNQLIFVFYDIKSVRDLVNDFYSFKAYVKPQDLFNAERTLKSLIYSRLSKESKEP